MSDTSHLAGGSPVPSSTLVQADQVTIVGDGSHQRPLRATAGGSSPTITPVETGDVILSASNVVVRVDPTGGPLGVTLPPATGAVGDVVVKNVSDSTHAVTVIAGAGDDIDGEASQVLSGDRLFWRAVSDGSHQWMVTSG